MRSIAITTERSIARSFAASWARKPCARPTPTRTRPSTRTSTPRSSRNASRPPTRTTTARSTRRSSTAAPAGRCCGCSNSAFRRSPDCAARSAVARSGVRRCFAKRHDGCFRPPRAIGSLGELTPGSRIFARSAPLVRDTRSISSLDHVIGTQQDRLRDGEAERLRGLEVDDEAEPRRLLERQIGGLLAPQDAQDEICAALGGFVLVGAIGHEAAIAGEGTRFIDSGPAWRRRAGEGAMAHTVVVRSEYSY